MSNNNESISKLDQQYYLPVFKRYPICFVKGEGSRLWDADGKEYIDALAGIAVNNLGHCHSKVTQAIKEQAEKLVHISNFFVSQPQVQLSKKLVALSGLERAFFTNSGAESVEGAIKIARKHAHNKGRGGEVISMENCFHGRTIATIASGKKQMQKGFAPIPKGFQQVPFNDIEVVKNAISKETAAIIVEPIQGEGGINLADESYLKALRELCDEHDIALIFDEIQCGVGRTGKMFCKEHYNVQPDIMTLAKGLGGGVPIGAILCNEKMAGAMDFGDHGTTFGGNPLVCAAALATIETIIEEDLLMAATEKGEWLRSEINGRKKEFPSIKDVRGKGLMIGVEFDFDPKPLVAEMLNNGVVANATAGNVLRLVPALNISYNDLKSVTETIFESINVTVVK